MHSFKTSSQPPHFSHPATKSNQTRGVFAASRRLSPKGFRFGRLALEAPRLLTGGVRGLERNGFERVGWEVLGDGLMFKEVRGDLWCINTTLDYMISDHERNPLQVNIKEIQSFPKHPKESPKSYLFFCSLRRSQHPKKPKSVL